MEAAASGLGIEIEILRFAKTRGCAAFKAGGRVDGDAVLKWLTDNEQELLKSAGSLSLKDRKLLEEIRKIIEDTRRLQIANDTKEKSLVSRAAVEAAIIATGQAVDVITETKLVYEWPEAVAGLDVAGARVYGRRLKDAVMAEIRKLSTHWEF